MKFPKKIYCLTLYLFIFTLSTAQQTQESADFLNDGIYSINQHDLFLCPAILLQGNNLKIPLSHYTPQTIYNQRNINRNNVEAIVCYAPIESLPSQPPNGWEEITPYTWRWIDLEVKKENQIKTIVNLRRPNWWITKMGAENVGNQLFLDMPEMGIQDSATVTNLRVSQLDTRFWDEKREGDFVTRPITGKFTHKSNQVYYLTFEGLQKPLGVTANHLIWSTSRNQWVEAKALKIGEEVKTHKGSCKLLSLKKAYGERVVYNLEVYKDHNYLVSMSRILVHNECWNQGWHVLYNRLVNYSYDAQYATYENALKKVETIGLKGEPFRVLYHSQHKRLYNNTTNLEGEYWNILESDAIRGGHKRIVIKIEISEANSKRINDLDKIAFERGYKRHAVEKVKAGSMQDDIEILTFTKDIGPDAAN